MPKTPMSPRKQALISILIILAVVIYREGLEAALFLLIFLAIWQVASIEASM